MRYTHGTGGVLTPCVAHAEDGAVTRSTDHVSDGTTTVSANGWVGAVKWTVRTLMVQVVVVWDPSVRYGVGSRHASTLFRRSGQGRSFP